MPVTKIKGTDIETSSFETKVETAVTSGAAANDVQAALPVGVILMYDGTGIADVATRTEDIGDRTGDTATLAGWKVCNGNGAPNLLNRFIRSENASGNTGGEDTHTLTISEMPIHSHEIKTGGETGGTVAYKGYTGGGITNDIRSGTNQCPTNYSGGGSAHENKPAYYSLIFIKKMA